jgi:hypothetical protein
MEDYDYYIYTSMDRIVRVVKTRRPYNTVRVPNTKFYRTNYIPLEQPQDLLYEYNYSRSKGNGFYVTQDKLDESTLAKLKNITIKIILSERFEAATELLKYTIIKRTADEDIFNRILMQQIEEYLNKGDVGSLLEAEYKCSKFDNIESYIEFIKLKYSDASEILAYIRYKQKEILELLNEEKFNEVHKIINEIDQKYAM